MPYPTINPFHIGVVTIGASPVLLGDLTGAGDIPDEIVNLIVHFASGTGTVGIGGPDIDLTTFDDVITTMSAGDTFNLGGGDNRIPRLLWKDLYIHGDNATDKVVVSGQLP